MGTRNHPIQGNQPYFVTANTASRRPVFADDHAARLFLAELGRLRRGLGFALLGYVVMPDHIHLVVAPGPIANLSRIMQSVKGRFAREWNHRRGKSGSIWQQRYYESAVRSEQQLVQWLKYIDDNPVHAGLTHSPQEYPYCSAGGWMATDLEAYLGGSWSGRAEAQPSEEIGALSHTTGGKAALFP